jgi:hypothetical protein
MKRVNYIWRFTALLALIVILTVVSMRSRAEAQAMGLCSDDVIVRY